MIRVWRDHSFIVICFALGLVSLGLALWFIWPPDADRMFDIWIGVAHAFLTVAGIYMIAGISREKNKVEG
jgi:hypothetical protein